MKKLKYSMWFLVTALIIVIDILPQEYKKPFVVNNLIGDTLDLDERNYYLLFPNIDGFQYAVFYLNVDCTLHAEVTYIHNELLKQAHINNYRSLKSLDYHIRAKYALEHGISAASPSIIKNLKSVSKKGTEISVFFHEGEERVGELLAVRQNSLLMLKENCEFSPKKLDCIWKANQSEIEQVIIEGNSYLGLGLGLGLIASTVAGVWIYRSNYDEEANTSFIDFRAMDSFEKSISAIIFSTIGLTALGIIIGEVSSTPDTVVDIIDENDIQGLRKFSRFPLSEPKEFKAIE